MLYFIKSQDYLKIGYTKDEITYNKRLSTYKTHNPDFKVLDVVKEGNSKDEIELHRLLKEHSYYGVKFYPNLKILEKYGYLLTRFLDIDTFKYKIERIQD